MNNDSLKFRVFKAIMASSLQAFRWRINGQIIPATICPSITSKSQKLLERD